MSLAMVFSASAPAGKWEKLLELSKNPGNAAETVRENTNTKLAARAIAYTAFGYSYEESAKSGPQFQGQDLEKVLRNHEHFSERLPYFVEIAREFSGVKGFEEASRAQQWSLLSKIISLKNAVYPEDGASALEIDASLKQAIAWKCLRAVNPDFVRPGFVTLSYNQKCNFDL